MADQFHVPDNVDPGIRRMIDALTPEYLRPNTKTVDPNAPPGKIPSVDPINPAPFLAVDLLGNVAGLGAKAVGAGLKGAIFAGPMAANAPHKAYDLTRAALLNAKREPGIGTVIPDVNDSIVRALWAKHGISPGLEGGLRHEIQDFPMQIRGADLPNFTKIEGKVGQIVHHPELYKAYPWLKEYPLKVEKGADTFGMWNPGERSIAVTAPNYAETRKTLAHELQHAVQQNERTPPWGNPEYILNKHVGRKFEWGKGPFDKEAMDLYKRHAGEVEATNVADRLGGHQYYTPPWLTEETTRANQLVPHWWLENQMPSTQAAFEQVPNLANRTGVNPATMYRMLLGK